MGANEGQELVSLSLPPPSAVGLPRHFTSWRKSQEQAVDDFVNSPHRYIGMAAPTGCGKSMISLGIAALTGYRTLVLTKTKELQTQYIREFKSMGLCDMRGQNSYACVAATDFGYDEEDHITVDHGPCHYGEKCDLMNAGCLYFDALRAARRSNLVITNYAYWLAISQVDGFPLYPKITRADGSTEYKPFDLLVLDEAHDSFDSVSDFLSAEILEEDCESYIGEPLPQHDNIDRWRQWGLNHIEAVEVRYKELCDLVKDNKQLYREHRVDLGALKTLTKHLRLIASLKGRWVAERRPDSVIIAPVWPTHYVESYLFRGIQKVLLMSATIRPKTLEILGIEPERSSFFDYDSTFPVGKRPVYYIPTVRMNYRTSEQELGEWIDRIDEIIEMRLDRKGLIHSVSYERAKFIKRNSRFGHLMIIHDPRSSRLALDRFRKADAPSILVSPSMTTGVDLPMDQCEYAIWSKCPFPHPDAAVTKARSEMDPGFTNYLTVQEIIQGSGRVNRSEEDSGETFIVDDTFKFLYYAPQNKKLWPRWFRMAVRTRDTVPSPLPKL